MPKFWQELFKSVLDGALRSSEGDPAHDRRFGKENHDRKITIFKFPSIQWFYDSSFTGLPVKYLEILPEM